MSHRAIRTDGSKCIRVWTDDIETGALQQAHAAYDLPFTLDVALMPDVHQGYGLPIGGVFVSDNQHIVPYFVGNDIGCGMCALNTRVPIDMIDTDALMQSIAKDVPVGFNDRENSQMGHLYDRSVHFGETLATVETMFLIQKNDFLPHLQDSSEELQERVSIKIRRQLGTLGGGNHFLELQRDEEGNAWFMIHSGSRALGGFICDVYHKEAVHQTEQLGSGVPEPCSYLSKSVDSHIFQGYYFAMQMACRYAELNRDVMLWYAMKNLETHIPYLSKAVWYERTNIHHNYAEATTIADTDVLIHRKGATSARKGEIGIIPGSMATKSYIVEGLGNVFSYYSCSHGSGRTMSRTKAKKAVRDGLVGSAGSQMGNVSVYGTRSYDDELPHAYKNVEDVMNKQTDLVKVLTELTPVAVLKG